MDKYVVFNGDSVRIQYVKPTSGQFLVNPEIPRGVPPHQWQLFDGRIVVKGSLLQKLSFFVKVNTTVRIRLVQVLLLGAAVLGFVVGRLVR